MLFGHIYKVMTMYTVNGKVCPLFMLIRYL